jgi:uncharacterized protein DUF6259
MNRFATRLIPIALLTLLSASHADGPAFRESNESLRIDATRWSLTLDAQTGAIRRIEDRSATGTLLQGNKNLWVVERHDQPEIEASTCTFQHTWDSEKHQLTLRYDGSDATVEIACTAAEEGPTWQPTVTMKRGTMIGWRFPNALQFNVTDVHEFIFPDNLGLAFTRSFFEPGGAGIERHHLGGTGLQTVADDRCQMRPVKDEPVAAKPGRDATDWLPAWYLNEIPRWQVTANRCPAGDKHNVSLVETEHGTWLSGYRLGGWGHLFRLGGMLQQTDTRPQIASVIATLAGLHNLPAEDGTDVNVPTALAGKRPAQWLERPAHIGVFLGRPSARPGSRLQPDPSLLIRELGRQKWLADAGINLVVLRDPSEIRSAFESPRKWFAIVNLIGEGFPADSAEQADSMLLAIRDYVRNGGIWWEAGGGYSFFHGLVPQNDAHFESANHAFCDFAALNSQAGRWACFGIQHPDDIYIPAQAEIAATGTPDARLGKYTHKFLAFATPDDTVQLPKQQMVVGSSHRDVLGEYAKRNSFTQGLQQKASAEVVEKLKRSILLKVSTGNLRNAARIAEELPFPVLFHIADYLHGGFDKQYPDHLPPRSDVGTPEDLSHLIKTCRENGHLFMPYTNPTWWCTNPKGPTFEQQGDASLSRDFDGNIYPEQYGLPTIQGYSVCAWHPAVRAANDVIRNQFTQQYPVDVLFQDQVGARRSRWDTNPASPHPGAYLEGIHQIARVDSRFVLLGTEDGHDRLINWETIFSGLSWSWLPNRPSRSRVLYEDRWPKGSWRFEPLALFLAHDKVLFYHHDLGGFIRNRRDLSISLVMGYGLSWWTRSVEPSPKERDWIERLCRIQAAIGPRCAGRPLDEFEYPAPNVIRSRWGDLEIIANLTNEPWKLDTNTTIAPEGFFARSTDLEAGILLRHSGKDDDTDQWLIRDKRTHSTQWTAQTELIR